MLKIIWKRIRVEAKETLHGFLLLPLMPLFLLAAIVSWLIPAVLRIFLKPHPKSYASPERIHVWMALSDLYADTLPDYKYISRVLRESGFERDEILEIFEVDVGPACFPLGSWMGFDQEKLIQTILKNGRSYQITAKIPLLGFVMRRFFTSLSRSSFKKCWQAE